MSTTVPSEPVFIKELEAYAKVASNDEPIDKLIWAELSEQDDSTRKWTPCERLNETGGS